METMHLIVIREAERQQLLSNQAELLQLMKSLQVPVAGSTVPYITAMEFIQAVRIGRAKFDQLVAANKIKTIRKDRNIYVTIREVESYFKTGTSG